MQKFLSLLFVVCCTVGLQVAVFVYGWGLQPKSWWWIIGGGVFGATALRTLADNVVKESNSAVKK